MIVRDAVEFLEFVQTSAYQLCIELLMMNRSEFVFIFQFLFIDCASRLHASSPYFWAANENSRQMFNRFIHLRGKFMSTHI